MRLMWACVLVGCSSPPVVEPPRDANVVVVEDAGVDVKPIGVCPGDPEATVGCYTTGARCGDAGFLYLCSGGLCPTGDVGACEVTKADSIGNGSEACCEKQACTRMEGIYAPYCAKLTDGGRPQAWFCPKGMKPPGACAPKEPGAEDFCCAD